MTTGDAAPDGPLDRFRDRYRLTGIEVFDEIEREVIGAVFGANGYTTMRQAEDMAGRLDLGPGSVLLDVGGGRGWPSLYMADRSGCDVVVTDVVTEGIATIDRQRALGVLASDGELLAFRAAVFDAVVHADVLC